MNWLINSIGSHFSKKGENARLSILIYHQVLPAYDFMKSNEITLDEFRMHMQLASQYFNVLPLSEAVDRLKTKSLSERSLCITFDDGYMDNRLFALPVLKEYGLSATFFIASNYLNGGIMWNDMVIEALRQNKSSTLDLSKIGLSNYPTDNDNNRRKSAISIIKLLKYIDYKERMERVTQIIETCHAIIPSDLMMNSADIVSLRDAGMSIGGHTKNHPILACLDRNLAREEIATGKEELEHIIREPITLFAYPNGVPGTDYKQEHVKIVKELGFLGAVSTAHGVANAKADVLQLPRFTPWDKSRPRFLFRMWQNLARAKPAITV